MIDDLTDDRLDALVRAQRPDKVHTSRGWRQVRRDALLEHIHGARSSEVVTRQTESSIGGGRRGASTRRWGWAAAGVLITAGVAALATLSSNDPVAVGPGDPDASDAPTPASSPAPTVLAAPAMVAPGIAVSPEVVELLALPTCDSAAGLAEWTSEQLAWWRDIDPSAARPASFADVTTDVAVDTAATSATCSIAIEIDGVFTWGLGDGTGNWVARATGVPDAKDYAWPEVERDRNGDDGTGGSFGTGQYFNDFNVRTTDLESTAAGALSPSSPSGSSPIYVIEFADDVAIDAGPSRLFYLRTTASTLDETVGGEPDPSLIPALVPEGFGRCTIEYGRVNSTGQCAIAYDYCDTTTTFTVTAGRIADGEPVQIDGIDMLVERADDELRVGLAIDGPMVIGPAEVPVNAMAATLASIPSATDARIDTTGTAVAAPAGALVLDQFPTVLADATGYSYVGEPEESNTPETRIQRWYTATMAQPELDVRLKVVTTSALGLFSPLPPPKDVETTEATVNSAPGWLYDEPDGGRTIAFVDDTAFLLTGYQLDDNELLAAAENTSLAPDGVGAVVANEGLPAGLVERAVGTASEAGFLAFDSSREFHASIRWYNPRPDGSPPDDGEPMLWLGWTAEDPDLLPLRRLHYDTATDTIVRGHPGFIATDTESNQLTLIWSENGYTYTLAGFELDQAMVLDAANQLRPSTDTDWAALEPEPG